MNRIKLLMVACLLGMAATASAQFANSKGSSSQGSDMSGWQGLRVSYHPMSLSPDKGDNIGITGFSAGYVKGFALSQSTPIFLEVGANLLWASKDLTEDFGLDDYDEDVSVKLNMFSVNIRSEEHTSELQSHWLVSYAVFCLKKRHRVVQGAGGE